MIDALQAFTESVHPFWQWAAVILISAIPFVESYGGALVGVLAGAPVIVAIIAAVIGNWISMVLVVLLFKKIRERRGSDEKPLTPRRQKFKERFDKFGVAGVSLLGQTVLPSQITSGAMVGWGASRSAVIFWQTISIILWGIAFGVLGMLGVNLLAGR
ncbi:hypothetical protein FVA74_01060 [Salinibacterium sp. dk2585]|uniref:hypothetical protein n=1 Tax=unclassified Salinibacterium TaxID=2632331 RepID=UPI0011C25811|nr:MULTISPECIES: hypothetical protein [unclassified Salinibacterium]QEE60310.1 hypothetical protein FVA74_01060 [Salinibacterium sp. dk2585]TXK55382.1 hypothetical protein FVP63_01205 [Salinibacterium sp. dk5596]